VEIFGLQHDIEEGNVSLSDEEIIEKFETWIPSYNAEGAAEGYFSFISSISFHKPQLIPILLRKAVEPLYFLGIESVEEVLKWAEIYLKNSNAIYKPSVDGQKWLNNDLSKYREQISEILREIKTT
jgi:hypothetical protein